MARGKCLYCGRSIKALNQGILLNALKNHYMFCEEKRLQRAALARGKA